MPVRLRRPVEPDSWDGPRRYGNKAGLLLEARERGLPVPPLKVLSDGEPLSLPDELRGGLLAVRSAFQSEDNQDSSNAGRFHTELNVLGTIDAVATAVKKVRGSGTESDRRHVLIMRQVNAVTAGVAFSEPGFEDDLVNVTDGLADRLVDGSVAGTDVRLPRLRHRFDSAAGDHSADLVRLAHLLRRVRSVFGDEAAGAGWDIEWADDGERCWLIQIRPITAAPLRNETFTLANHKEILPELPSVFMTSLIEDSSDRLLAFYTELDPSLPLHRPFVETFAGRPYLNLSMLTDMMRTLGLPSQLVTDSYGGEPDVRTPLRPSRLVTRPLTLAKLGLAQVTAVPTAQKAADSLRNMAATTDTMDRFGPVLDTLAAVYEGLVQNMGSLASGLAPPVAMLRSLGALDGHLATQRTAAAEMLDDLHLVRTGRWTFDRWLAEHGHRGTFESDISRPRFVEDQRPIRAALEGPPPAPTRSQRSLRSVLTLPLWWAARRPMRTREHLRSEAMKGFLSIRRNLLRLAEAAVADGRLTDPDDLWLLTVNEVRSLDSGTTFTSAHFDQVRALRAEQATVRVPDTLRRFDDPNAAASDEARTTFRGVPLVPGTITGVALRCSEPPLDLPDGFDPATTVLIARSVDAGWTPIFSRVAAVAVEIGGDLSHGSIILRELQIPSITNIGEIGFAIETGTPVTLNANTATLELLQTGLTPSEPKASDPT